LHTFLESGQQFANWVPNRAKESDLVEDKDFGVCFINLGSKECGVGRKGRGGHNTTEYWFTLDAAKEVSMMERNATGKQARRYFIACEKRLRNKLPTQAIDFRERYGADPPGDRWLHQRELVGNYLRLGSTRALLAETEAAA
jgi:phage anti-repressor protein